MFEERIFVIRMNNASTAPNFTLNDLPGAGRMDIACRAVSTAIFLSYSLRKDVKVYLNLNGPPNPPITILFYTNELKNVYPDERNIASHIKIALRNFENSEKFIKSEEGIYIAKKSFESLIKEFIGKYEIFYLTTEGEDIRKVNFSNKVCFILGDNKGIPKKTEKFLDNLNIKRVSVGKIEYLTSQVISIVNYELDRKV